MAESHAEQGEGLEGRGTRGEMAKLHLFETSNFITTPTLLDTVISEETRFGWVLTTELDEARKVSQNSVILRWANLFEKYCPNQTLWSICSDVPLSGIWWSLSNWNQLDLGFQVGSGRKHSARKRLWKILDFRCKDQPELKTFWKVFQHFYEHLLRWCFACKLTCWKEGSQNKRNDDSNHTLHTRSTLCQAIVKLLQIGNLPSLLLAKAGKNILFFFRGLLDWGTAISIELQTVFGFKFVNMEEEK